MKKVTILCKISPAPTVLQSSESAIPSVAQLEKASAAEAQAKADKIQYAISDSQETFQQLSTTLESLAQGLDDILKLDSPQIERAVEEMRRALNMVREDVEIRRQQWAKCSNEADALAISSTAKLPSLAV